MISILKKHLRLYPKIQAEDIIKLCYQNEFGCEHLMIDQKQSLQMLIQESASLDKQDMKIEPIGNHLVRLYFGQLTQVEAYTMHQLLVLTATTHKGNVASFINKLHLCQQYLNDSIIDQKINDYLAKGIEAIHHSQLYHQTYEPHYRVIHEDFLNYYSIFLKINQLRSQKKHLLIAIDGKCGSGKTTLATLLNSVYQGHLFHMDDFFLQPHQRTSERLDKPGENVDHERFLKEVLQPLSLHQAVHYQRFDCHTMSLSKQIDTISYSNINIIEGTYSMHPNLIDYYDLKIAINIDDITQIERIIKRNGSKMAKKFKEIWIPLENKYFKQLAIFSKADIIYESKNNHEE